MTNKKFIFLQIKLKKTQINLFYKKITFIFVHENNVKIIIFNIRNYVLNNLSHQKLFELIH